MLRAVKEKGEGLTMYKTVEIVVTTSEIKRIGYIRVYLIALQQLVLRFELVHVLKIGMYKLIIDK